MEERFFANYNSPIGFIRVESDSQALISVKFDEIISRQSEGKYLLLDMCIKQLNEYFTGNRKEFDLPVYIDGTVFQKKVWDAVSKIKYGKTVSYTDLSKSMKSPLAIRAIAAANARNKLMLIIPCHRVIGADGSMVGYAGGIERKQWLLNHEAENSGFPTLF